MADRAESEPQEVTDTSADDHDDDSNDTQQITPARAAETHESAARRAEREATLQSVRANQIRIHEGNTR